MNSCPVMYCPRLLRLLQMITRYHFSSAVHTGGRGRFAILCLVRHLLTEPRVIPSALAMPRWLSPQSLYRRMISASRVGSFVISRMPFQRSPIGLQSTQRHPITCVMAVPSVFISAGCTSACIGSPQISQMGGRLIIPFRYFILPHFELGTSFSGTILNCPASLSHSMKNDGCVGVKSRPDND